MRRQKITIGIYVEGISGERFLNFLIKQMSLQKVHVNVYDCGGGSPDKIAEKAIRLSEQESENVKIFYCDCDGGCKKLSEEIKNKLLKVNFKEILLADFCLEGDLWQIIDKKWRLKGKTSLQIKKSFLKKFCRAKTSITEESCKEFFKMEFLGENKRISNPVQIIYNICREKERDNV